MNNKFNLFNPKHIKSILKTLFIIIFIGIIFYEGKKELASIKIEDVKTILMSLPVYTLILFVVGGMLVASASFIHDFIISKELSIKLSKIKIFKIGFISNTLNNALGGLSSAGIRVLFYGREGLDPKEAAYYNILIVTSFSSGLSALTFLVLFNLDSIHPIFERYEFALIATIIILFYMPLFFMINRFKWIKKKLLGENASKIISINLLKKLFLSSLFEWTLTALFFCIISLYFSRNANFIDLFSVFIISSVIGVVSLVPGAIGAFDITLLLGMSAIQIDMNKAVVSLMIFRLFYYIVPLIIASLISIPLFLEKHINRNSNLIDNKTNIKYWSISSNKVLEYFNSSKNGLSSKEAELRLVKYGENSIKRKKKSSASILFLSQFKNPIVIILIFATSISAATGEWIDALIIFIIVLGSSILSFFQEYSASNAIEQLREKVQTKVTVLRDDNPIEIASVKVVPGDIIKLSAGSLIPADGLIIESLNFFVNQSILTGESIPSEKNPTIVPEDSSIEERINSVFMGTNVNSGSATVVVLETGANTEFGEIAKKLTLRPTQTEFEIGVRNFGYLLSKIMLILTLVVFAINVLLKRPAIDSLLFSVALAVGITPQLLPAIISITLSKGSRNMAKAGVIVRRLNAIENFGSMDVLCTDKTGTLTEGKIRLDGVTDFQGQNSDTVFRSVYINAKLQTGMSNSLDQTIIDSRDIDITTVKKIDEIPFDFTRERLSVIVHDDNQYKLIVKGAFNSVLEICNSVQTKDTQKTIDDNILTEIQNYYADWSNQGIRVLGVAEKIVPLKENYTVDDEINMVFLGFLLLFDHPKAEVAETIINLQNKGISLRIITGDNRLVTAHIANAVGLKINGILTGSDLMKLNEGALLNKIETTTLFAEVDSNQKERIIMALKKRGHVVGYMGDGINDVPALYASDVSISVDNAVDVAKESADFVLMQNSLKVLNHGVELGRTTFSNTLKYILATTSANFGNMFSMAGASFFLPFLPLLPKQILMINFLTDFPALNIARDFVDLDILEKPRKFDIGLIKRFMFTFGFISSVFDYLTFAVLFIGFKAQPRLFQSGWFVFSILTELLVLLLMRTHKPLYKSKPAPILMYSVAIVAVITLILPYLKPLNKILNIEPLSPFILISLFIIILMYIITTEIAKHYFYKSKPNS